MPVSFFCINFSVETVASADLVSGDCNLRRSWYITVLLPSYDGYVVSRSTTAVRQIEVTILGEANDTSQQNNIQAPPPVSKFGLHSFCIQRDLHIPQRVPKITSHNGFQTTQKVP